jgi:hypothetical protein
MSKKNLARTAIEGGRSGSNRYDRRYSNRLVRVEARAFVSRVSKDADAADNDYVPSRKEVFPHNYRVFNDKLSPVRRWMDKQVGKNWDKVHSELRARFDARTIAGQHILFDHLLNDVDPHPYVVSYGFFGLRRYFVDETGILRARPRPRYHDYNAFKRTVSDEALNAWRGDRYVSEVGSELFWLVVARVSVIDGAIYRQGNKLSKTERAFYERLKPFEKILVQLKGKE